MSKYTVAFVAMNEVLKLLLEGESLSTQQMGAVLHMDVQQLQGELHALDGAGILLGWRPIIHPEHLGDGGVRAVIEIKMNTERGGGYDRIAERISRFERVESCYLMSGTYDLMVVLRSESLKHVASFVYEKLATIEGVISTSTHFLLKAYKEQGFFIERAQDSSIRPVVS